MKIQTLNLSPLKSGALSSVAEAVCGERGFVGDREWMVVDADSKFLTQRNTPLLGLLRAEPFGDTLRLTFEGESVEALATGEVGPVRVWSSEVEAQYTQPEVDRWLSGVLGRDARLVRRRGFRATDGDWAKVPLSFADGYPYLIANTASLADLNHRIEGAPLVMDAFRANLVVDTTAAWAEDTWKRVRMGEAEFEVTTPCERCKITTLDPVDPRVVRRDGEPLKTLATFRRHGSGVVFAVNAVCLTPGATIRVGDVVEALG